jgi:hypothetical protein
MKSSHKPMETETDMTRFSELAEMMMSAIDCIIIG